MNKYLIIYTDAFGEKAESVVRASSLDEALAYFNSKTPFISKSIKDLGEDKEVPQIPTIGPN